MEDIIGLEEVESMLDLSARAILRGVKRGELPALRIGRKFRFSRSVIADLVRGGGVSGGKESEESRQTAQ